MSDLSTSRLHYVKVPENHIVIDFDIQDMDGNKSYELNLKEASKWPPTYAELSKSGQGIHLHYIYAGDVSKLSRVYDDHIEVKVFTGKSSLRRKLTKCNDLPIATINSGLPLKGEKQVINFEGVKSEKGLRTQIKRNLNKEYHPATKPSIDFIYKILEDAYASGLNYDVTDMRNAVLAFAASSTHQADYCIKLVNKMQFKSADQSNISKRKNWIDGITLSGGEPFCHIYQCALIAEKAHEMGLSVWCYTGYLFEDLYRQGIELLKNIDVLVDGLFVQAEKSLDLDFRGSRNQRVIDIPESLKEGVAILKQT